MPRSVGVAILLATVLVFQACEPDFNRIGVTAHSEDGRIVVLWRPCSARVDERVRSVSLAVSSRSGQGDVLWQINANDGTMSTRFVVGEEVTGFDTVVPMTSSEIAKDLRLRISVRTRVHDLMTFLPGDISSRSVLVSSGRLTEDEFLAGKKCG